MMKIDEYDFENTARAVFIMNESARERHATWEDLREFMIEMANTYCYKSNSFSTGGFCLTAYDTSGDYIRTCRASVSGFLALRYLEKETADV
jgi:hypothetical protein